MKNFNSEEEKSKAKAKADFRKMLEDMIATPEDIKKDKEDREKNKNK